MLTAVVPALPKFAPIQTTHDIGRLPSEVTDNSTYTYYVNKGTPVPLQTVQSSDVSTTLKVIARGQTVTSQHQCVHVIEEFPFTDGDSYPVVFSFDEGAGCPYQESYVLNVQEDTTNCHTPVIQPTAAASTAAGATSSGGGPAATTAASPGATGDPTCGSGAAKTSTLQEVTLSDGLQVLCDTETDGGGWVVFQRRTDGKEDFFKKWDEYLAKFGDFGGDFWLGLQNLHTLCPPSKPCSLRVDLKDDQNSVTSDPVWAQYASFSVKGDSENYQLSLSGYDNSSTAGDAMLFGGTAKSANLDGMSFTTSDKDNDKWSSENCAGSDKGAWWYNACTFANLNGHWGDRGNTGLRWYGPPVNTDFFATFSEMKVRVN